MPRPLLIKSNQHPYHIMARTNNKEFFPLHLDEVWKIMLNNLRHCHEEKKLAIHALVLMGNHFHLLCHTPNENIDECMHYFMRSTAVRIYSRVNMVNHLWGGRYRWSLINSQRHYFQVYRYILQNPLRANIVNKVQDYPYSSLSQNLPFPLHSMIPMSFGGIEGELLWLNEKYDQEDVHLIQSGLRKSQFDLNKRKLKSFDKFSLPRCSKGT